MTLEYVKSDRDRDLLAFLNLCGASSIGPLSLLRLPQRTAQQAPQTYPRSHHILALSQPLLQIPKTPNDSCARHQSATDDSCRVIDSKFILHTKRIRQRGTPVIGARDGISSRLASRVGDVESSTSFSGQSHNPQLRFERDRMLGL
jgi:hypothetical protein